MKSSGQGLGRGSGTTRTKILEETKVKSKLQTVYTTKVKGKGLQSDKLEAILGTTPGTTDCATGEKGAFNGFMRLVHRSAKRRPHSTLQGASEGHPFPLPRGQDSKGRPGGQCLLGPPHSVALNGRYFNLYI